MVELAFPDFGRTLAQADQFQANRLNALAQRNALAQETAFNDALRANADALNATDPAARINALTMLARSGRQGAAMALPLIQRERDSGAVLAAMGMGGTPPAAPVPAGPAAPSGGAPSSSDPLAVRLNNPGALRYVAGQPFGAEPGDRGFGRYPSPEAGAAASARQLRLYAQRGINTLPRIIETWAPSSDGNNPAAYTARVAAASGLPADQPLDLNNPDVLTRLLTAMATVESGRPADPAVIGRGVQMALGVAGRPGAPVAAGGPPAPAGTSPPAAPATPPGAPPGRRDSRIEAMEAEAATIQATIERLTPLSVNNEQARQMLQFQQGRLNGLLQRIATAQSAAERAADRDAPGLTEGRARVRLSALAPVISSGAATQEQVREYLDAIALVQREQIAADGTRIVPRLPAYAPGEDFVARLYNVQRPGTTPSAPAPVAQPGAPPAPAAPTPPPADGGVARTQPAPLSESQSQANLFGLLMENGDRIIRATPPPSSATIFAWRNAPESVVNLGLSESDQRYFNAVRQFAAGILRRETGAAFSAQELLDVHSRFFPAPGDSAATIQQKEEARRLAIEALRSQIPGGFRAAAPSGSAPPAGAAPAPPSGRWNPNTRRVEPVQ